ncbi:TPA: methyltransferase domain-containing protein [Candidatus Poribacteria bacterium]|nr:methyltransferase domain-containing protein [Candidatus Poribacteria bacterium]
MKDGFFYLTSRSKLDRPLIEAELMAFAGVKPDRFGLGISPLKADISRSAFINFGAEMIFKGGDLEELKEYLSTVGISADGFAIKVERLGAHPGMGSPQMAGMIADLISGRPNLSRPKVRFLLAMEEDQVLFGKIFSEASRAWVKLSRKPHTTSSSIPHRLARAMINLSGLKPPARLIDPCCGAGTILLEGAEMGYEVTGYDLNYKMIKASLKNLAHFGLSGKVIQADAREIEGEFDLLVTDLPYGINMKATEGLYRELLGNFVNLAPISIIAVARDISGMLKEAGYRSIRLLPAPKHSMTRYIFIARVST